MNTIIEFRSLLINVSCVIEKDNKYYPGYFNIDDNVGSILSMILTDDQKNKYHQVWKEIFKNVNDGNGELMLHEKIRLIDSNFPIEKIFKIHSVTIVITSLIKKDNKFYLELALNRCLFEPYEIKL